MPDFTTLDYIFGGVIVILAIRGIFKGFITELLSMLAIILGIGSALLFSKKGVLVLERIWGQSGWNQVIAFLIIFIVVYIIIKLFENFLHSLFENLNLEKLDKALGFFLGVGEGFLLIVVVLFILNWQPFFDVSDLITNSFFAKFLLPLLPPPSVMPLPKEAKDV